MSAPYRRCRWMWGVGSKRLIPVGKLQHIQVVIQDRLRGVHVTRNGGQHRYLVGNPVEKSFRDREVHGKDQQIRAPRPQGCGREGTGGVESFEVFYAYPARVDSDGVWAATVA